MRSRVVMAFVFGLAIGLLLSVAVLRGESSKPAANGEHSSMRSQSSRMLAVLDNRQETVKTLEAARAAAEADLREAVRQHPIDETLVRSLTAEIVSFGQQLVADEEQMRSEVERILSPEADASR